MVATLRPGSLASQRARARAGRQRRVRRRQRLRHALTVLSFIGPSLVGLVLFLGYPLLATLYFSVHAFDLFNPPRFVGLRYYRYLLFDDPNVVVAARNTLWLVLILVPLRVVAALATAALLVRLRRASTFYRTVFYLPSLTPPVAATVAFVFLFNPGTGPVNGLLDQFGITGPLWFNDPAWAKPSLTLLGLWGLGDVMIIFLAGLLDVPRSMYEAAALDGVNPWQRFRFVTLPAIAPVLWFTVITGVIQTLQYFTQAAVAGTAASGQATVGQGRTEAFGYPQNSTMTFPMWLYEVGFNQFVLGYAATLSVVLFVFSFGVTLLLLRRAAAFGGEEVR